MTFATRLSCLRQEHHMSQQELANELGISRSAVGMYEQGKREPDFEVLDKIADLFDVDLSYLLGHSNTRGAYPRHQHKNEDAFTLDERNIIYAYRSAPDDVKRLILFALKLS